MQALRQPTSNMGLRDLASWAMGAHQYMRSLKLSGGRGVTVSYGPNGATISAPRVKPRPSTSAPSAAAPLPFAMTDASVLTGTPVAKVLVNYGWVNNFIPTLGGVSLSLAPLLSLTSGAGTYLVYLDFTYGSGVIVSSGLSVTIPADTGSHTYNPLGEVDVVASGGGFIVQAIRNAHVSSLTAQFSSGTQYHWGQQ